MNFEVRILSSDEPLTLPDSLAQSAGFIALDSWMKFIEKIYNFPIYRIISQKNDGIVGVLALVHVTHPVFGNYLATAPFGSYGGFAFSSHDVRDALLDQAKNLAKDLGVEYVNVRFDAGEMTPPDGWIQHPAYATYRAELSPDTEKLLASYSSDHRNHVRKSLKKNFSVKFGRLDLLDDAYEGLVRSMHELGSPYHSKDYLRTMAESLDETLEFAVIYGANGKLAGTGVFIFQGDVATNLHLNILHAFRSDYAGEFLYWSVITRYCEKGFRVFDMGRSLIGSGNEVFKSKWKPEKHLLAYWYSLREGTALPELNQKNPKFQIAIWMWKHLPTFVIRPLGPFLIKGLA